MRSLLAALVLTLASALAVADPDSSVPYAIGAGQFMAISFHDVRDDVIPERDPDPYAISTERLAAWFDWMRTNNWQPVALQQIIDAANGGPTLPPNAVLLTFDDGLANIHSHVFPLLQAYDYPALVALQTGWLETVWSGESAGYSGEDFTDRPATVRYNDRSLGANAFVDRAALSEIQASGLVEFASHSHDLHRGILANPQGNLQPAAITRRFDAETGDYEGDDAFRARIRADLERSREAIKAMVDRPPRAMVWPYGANTRGGSDRRGSGHAMDLFPRRASA
ncbi:MAG: polysaccharide deacetylase family protein [Arhodomonas sp.]|nr:polysaccharide deacetylase family protein [Arhodomonas sp.]